MSMFEDLMYMVIIVDNTVFILAVYEEGIF